MKKNMKIAAAVILVLTMVLTMFGALATDDGVNTGSDNIVVEPTADPTEEPAAEPTEEPAADPAEEPAADPTEEPAADPTEEPAADPTEEPAADPTEEPAADPTEEPAADPTEEPAADPTEEPAADPTEEPAADPTEEPAADPTEEPAADPTEEPVVEPTVEPTPVPVEGTVEVRLATSGDIYFGDVVKFEAVIEGYTMAYTIQWQYDDGYGWKNVEGANEEELRVEVTEKNFEWEWRVAVITEDIENIEA